MLYKNMVSASKSAESKAINRRVESASAERARCDCEAWEIPSHAGMARAFLMQHDTELIPQSDCHHCLSYQPVSTLFGKLFQ